MKIENDRFILVPANMKEYNHLQSINDLNESKVKAIACFFENYNKEAGKIVEFREIADSKEAHKLIKKSMT
jgi:inorganic pyrophosphatase